MCLNWDMEILDKESAGGHKKTFHFQTGIDFMTLIITYISESFENGYLERVCLLEVIMSATPLI